MKTTQTQRTPGPWHVGNHSHEHIYDENGNLLLSLAFPRHLLKVSAPAHDMATCTANMARTAAFIVTACNTHSELVAALRHIQRICAPGVDQSDDDLEAAFAGIKDVARAALAKVTS